MWNYLFLKGIWRSIHDSLWSPLLQLCTRFDIKMTHSVQKTLTTTMTTPFVKYCTNTVNFHETDYMQTSSPNETSAGIQLYIWWDFASCQDKQAEALTSLNQS